MYPKFIELHAKDDKAVLLINIENIVGFGVDDGTVVIRTIDKGGWFIAESYDELKALITDCGCLIHKADPRLDMTHPLTLDDLRDMVGEPVWNSNIDVWMLVKDVSDTWVKMLWTSGNISEYTEDELISYPVYRMRRA